MSEARNKLVSAQAEMKTLAAEISRLEKTQSEAREMALEAEATLKGFAKLDSTISQWRASELKRGGDPRKLPAELKQKLSDRTNAQEEIEQSRDTLEIITNELTDARARFARLQGGFEQLAADVVYAEIVEALAAELAGLNERSWTLRRLLQGFARFGASKNIAVSQVFNEALRGWEPDGPEYAASDHNGAQALRWKVRVDALIKNPMSELSVPKAVLPGDYRGPAGAVGLTYLDEEGRSITVLQ